MSRPTPAGLAGWSAEAREARGEPGDHGDDDAAIGHPGQGDGVLGAGAGRAESAIAPAVKSAGSACRSRRARWIT